MANGSKLKNRDFLSGFLPFSSVFIPISPTTTLHGLCGLWVIAVFKPKKRDCI
ncbi:hypothetical protein OZ401_001651 [Candidatus Chlorohelix allophototropha]|uniref:Uncharacterized protein n=1 Tax=Candidatus Chlorohelix allophototropha TaxID=3003348 RepID=A0ABY9AYS5_9CHLR|nr:hypothetical protein OZ401_001651 [Chloroflexota bacterium L227-S17]